MLVDALRRRLGDPDAASFQLTGEDLVLLTGDDLAQAAADWQAALGRVAEPLRARVGDELAGVQREAHRFLRKYNRSVGARIAGYVELGRRCRFAYPWPVVAVLGIEQVLSGIRQNRVWGLVGDAARRLGWRALSQLSDGGEDVLRRTNRGIFADSVPTVLLGLRAHALASAGEPALAAALLDGPLPPYCDEECRAVARALADGLALVDRDARFAALARLTLRHFAREQAIFSHHIGPPPSRPTSPVIRRLLAMRTVPAPIVRHGTVRLHPFPLPRDFDLRDHRTRVAVFGRAFVESVTATRADYRLAAAHVIERWGRRGEQVSAE